MVVREGFEPSKAEPSDLQSDPFDRSGTPPEEACILYATSLPVNTFLIKNQHLRDIQHFTSSLANGRSSEAGRSLLNHLKQCKP